MENNAFDAFDTSSVFDVIMVIKGQEHKGVSQKEQMVYQLVVEIERNQFRNIEVFKAASENVAKQAKMKETRIIAKMDKTLEVATKQMATQELQIEKTQMEK